MIFESLKVFQTLSELSEAYSLRSLRALQDILAFFKHSESFRIFHGLFIQIIKFKISQRLISSTDLLRSELVSKSKIKDEEDNFGSVS